MRFIIAALFPLALTFAAAGCPAKQAPTGPTNPGPGSSEPTPTDPSDPNAGSGSATPGDCVCTMQYDPVCGTDGKTYGNACAAGCSKVEVASKGECPK